MVRDAGYKVLSGWSRVTPGGGGRTAMMNRGRRVTLSEFVYRPPGAESDAAAACLIKYFTLMKNGRCAKRVSLQPARTLREKKNIARFLSLLHVDREIKINKLIHRES